jgi:ribosome-binding factor A
MSSHKRRRRFARPPTGLEPARQRKSLQLCGQVAEALHLALGDCGDEALNDLLVLEVRPFPDSTRLLVLVRSATGATDLVSTRLRLREAAGWLRREIAAAIHRRRTPDLVFEVV